MAVAAVAMLAPAACSGPAEDDEQGAGRGSGGIDVERLGAAGSGQDPGREGPVEIDGAEEGGTVYLKSNRGLNTMDPTDAYYVNTLSILSGLVTRSLTQYSYDEESGDMVLVPDLATDLGTPNEDFTEWRFTIRDGVRWENGEDVTAEDVRYGILRSFDRRTFPNGPGFSNEYFLDGDTYDGPYRSGTDYPGVTVEGDTLTLRMDKPFADMPFWGAFPAMGPIPEGEDDPARYARHPRSTGPYMFEEYTPQRSLTLVRNPHWDPATDPARTAYPERYVMDFRTGSARIDRLLLEDRGDARTTMTYDDILAKDFRTFADEHSDRLVLGAQPCTTYWAPDYRKVTNIEVRKALAWAYPYRGAARAAGLIDGVTSIPGTNLMPPGIPGRTEHHPLAGHEPGSTDAAKAKQILREEGELGYEIGWLFARDDPSSVRAKDVVDQALRRAGFTPRPVATTIADFSTERSDPDHDEINVRSAGWCSDWPSGGSWFPPVLRSTDLDEEGLGANYAVFSEEDVDQRIEEILRADIQEQADLWNELDASVLREYFPLFVTRYGGVAQAHGSRIEGHHVDPTLGMPTWKRVRVD